MAHRKDKRESMEESNWGRKLELGWDGRHAAIANRPIEARLAFERSKRCEELKNIALVPGEVDGIGDLRRQSD